MSEHDQLGRLLVDRGLIDDKSLLRALAEQTETGAPLGRVLIEQGAITESELIATLAAQLGLDFVELDDLTVDPSAAAIIPPALARRYQAIPYAWEDGRLVVACGDCAGHWHSPATRS